MKLDIFAKCLFALAAVAGASFYGYDVLTRDAEPVYANAALAGRDGFAVTAATDGKGGNYLVVTTYAPDPKEKSKIRRAMTVYEIRGENAGKARLYLVGSRCIEHDSYWDLLNFDSPKGYSPDELRKEYEGK